MSVQLGRRSFVWFFCSVLNIAPLIADEARLRSCCVLAVPPFSVTAQGIESEDTAAIAPNDVPADAAIASQMRIDLANTLRRSDRDGGVRQIRLANYASPLPSAVRVIDVGRKTITMTLPPNREVILLQGLDADRMLILEDVVAERYVRMDSDLTEYRGRLELRGEFAIWDNRNGSVVCAGLVEVRTRPPRIVKRDDWLELAGKFAARIMDTKGCSKLFGR